MAGQPTSGWDAEYQAALQAQLNRDKDFRENTIGVLPVGATPMGLDEIRAAWPAQADKYGRFFTKNPGQSQAVRSGGSEKGFHPRGIEQFTDPKTGQKYERRTFYTVPSGTQLTDTPEYPLALAQRSFDPFSEKTVQELSAIPGVMDWVGRLRWSGDRSFSDLSPDEKQQAIYQTAQMMRDNYYASHFPNHTIAGNWMPVGEPTKKPQTEYMPGGWWGARGNSIAGAFQNGLTGINSMLPFELVPGMDGRKAISEAFDTFQHMDTRLPSHPDTKAAVDHLIDWTYPKSSGFSPFGSSKIQKVAERKTWEMLKMQRTAGAVFRTLDGSDKTWDELSTDERQGVVHEALRDAMASEIDRRQAEVNAWEGLQAENSRPVKDSGIMLESLNAGVGFLPTIGATYVTGGLGAGARGLVGAKTLTGAAVESVGHTLPFITGAYQRQTASPYAQIAGNSENQTAVGNLHALQLLNASAAAGNGLNYDQIRNDSIRRGVGAATGTAIAAPIVGVAANKIGTAVMPRAQALVSDAVNRVSPLKFNVTGSMANNPSFWVNSKLLGAANAGTKFAVNTATSAATMPIFPIFERAGEAAVALDAHPVLDFPAIGHDIGDYASLGAMFGPTNFLQGKMAEARFASKNKGAIGAFQADPRWFPFYSDKNPIVVNDRWTSDPRFIVKDALGNPIDPWARAYDNQARTMPESAQILGPQSTEAARAAYYRWLEGILGVQPPQQAPQPPPKPGLGG